MPLHGMSMDAVIAWYVCLSVHASVIMCVVYIVLSIPEHVVLKWNVQVNGCM